MNVQVKKLAENKIELTIEVPYSDVLPRLEKAAKRISERIEIPGFRKGQVPFSVLKTKYSEGMILEEASQDIVINAYFKAIQKEGLEPTEQPEISVQKAAPGNPFVFTATVSVLPELRLAELSSISVKHEVAAIEDKEIDKTLEELRKMRAKEKLVKREAKHGDKVIADFTVKRENVVIEGGQAFKQPVVIGEQKFIPGFEEQVVGMKSGEQKQFTLTFPEQYHEKSLAGKPATFDVKLHDVYEIELPELNEEFVKSLGNYASLDDVRAQIRKNLESEASARAQDTTDRKMIEQLIEKSEFGTLPESLYDGEVSKMMDELKFRVVNQGGKFEDYLSHLKKSEEQLRADLRPDAEKRVKTGLAIRRIGKQEKIEASEQEVNAELEKALAGYKGQPGVETQLKSPRYREYLKDTVTNRKIVEFLRAKTVQ